jgi:predicted Zn-dependent protease with MMP-like domain
MAEEVRITVLHELAHHFGFDEERMADLGLA